MYKQSLTWSRRIIQLSILVIMIISPVSQIINTLGHDIPYKESPLIRNERIGKFLVENRHKIDDYLEIFQEEISGGAYSIKIFFIKIAEPFTAFVFTVRNMLNVDYWNITLFFAFLIPIVITLLLGRVYCSYVCPWSLLVNANWKFQQKFFKRFPKFSASLEAKVPVWKKYYIFLFLLLILTNPLILQYILPAAIIQNSLSDYILFGNFTLWLTALFVLFLVEVIKPSFFCRDLCPTGIFLTFLGKWRIFSLAYKRKTNCIKDCELCIDSCWLGLQPKTHAKEAACDLCARCIKACPTGHLNIQPRRRFGLKYFILILPLLMACGQPISNDDSLDDFLSVTLYENSLKLHEEKDSSGVQASYAFVASEKSQKNGGEIAFDLHLARSQETLDGEIIIVCFENDVLQIRDTLPTVNFPISIINRSVYRLKFTYQRNVLYKLEVLSPAKNFKPFEVEFRYPPARF